MGRRTEPRKLVRWDHETDMLCFLAIPRVMAKRNMKFPWGEVAAYIGDHVSGNALLQHMAKETKKREKEGRPIPRDREKTVKSLCSYPLISASGFGGRSTNAAEGKEKGEPRVEKGADDDEIELAHDRFPSKLRSIPKRNKTVDIKEEINSDEYEAEIDTSPVVSKQRRLRNNVVYQEDQKENSFHKKRLLPSESSGEDSDEWFPRFAKKTYHSHQPKITELDLSNKSFVVILRFNRQSSINALKLLDRTDGIPDMVKKVAIQHQDAEKTKFDFGNLDQDGPRSIHRQAFFGKAKDSANEEKHDEYSAQRSIGYHPSSLADVGHNMGLLPHSAGDHRLDGMPFEQSRQTGPIFDAGFDKGNAFRSLQPILENDNGFTDSFQDLQHHLDSPPSQQARNFSYGVDPMLLDVSTYGRDVLKPDGLEGNVSLDHKLRNTPSMVPLPHCDNTSFTSHTDGLSHFSSQQTVDEVSMYTPSSSTEYFSGQYGEVEPSSFENALAPGAMSEDLQFSYGYQTYDDEK